MSMYIRAQISFRSLFLKSHLIRSHREILSGKWDGECQSQRKYRNAEKKWKQKPEDSQQESGMKERLTAILVRDLSLGQMHYTVAFTVSLLYRSEWRPKKEKKKRKYTQRNCVDIAVNRWYHTSGIVHSSYSSCEFILKSVTNCWNQDKSQWEGRSGDEKGNSATSKALAHPSPQFQTRKIQTTSGRYAENTWRDGEWPEDRICMPQEK